VLHIGIRWGALRAKDHFEHLGIDERIILKLIFKVWDAIVWTGLISKPTMIGTEGGCM
jgi:hypothetical protein